MFNRLHIYTVHVKPGKKPAFENPLFLREGFSFWAFALTFLWTLYHRLWWPTAIILVTNALIMALQNNEFISEGSGFVLLLAQQVIIGLHANDWLRRGLKKRGFITAGIVTGQNRLSAELRFFEDYAASNPHAALA